MGSKKFDIKIFPNSVYRSVSINLSLINTKCMKLFQLYTFHPSFMDVRFSVIKCLLNVQKYYKGRGDQTVSFQWPDVTEEKKYRSIRRSDTSRVSEEKNDLASFKTDSSPLFTYPTSTEHAVIYQVFNRDSHIFISIFNPSATWAYYITSSVW